MPADLVPVRSTLLDRLAELGVDVARMLRHARVARSRFGSGKASLTTREFFALWLAVEELAGTRDVGLRLGSQVEPHQREVESLAALHSPNLGEALTKLARYKRLCVAEEVRIEVTGDEARITFHWVHADAKLPMLLVDGAFARFVALARAGTGKPLTPLRVELARRRSDETMLKRHFGCEVYFDAPVDTLVLDPATFAWPFLRRNADMYAVMLPGLEAALRESTASTSLADDVKGVLRRSMSGQRPSVEKVAEEMHVSPRTLQRRLAELETSYQKLLDDVRDSTARRLLLDTDLTAGEIGFLLGFDELNSFTRAFHARAGATPARWREFQHNHLGAFRTASNA